MKDIIKLLEEKRKKAQKGGGKKRIDAQHEKGKLTAREYNLKVDYYDELKHYNKVRDKFYGSDK